MEIKENNRIEYKTLDIWRETAEQSVHIVRSGDGKTLAMKKAMHIDCLLVYQKLKQIRHKNLVQIWDVYEEQGKGIVIEEFINGESLATFLRRQESLPIELIEMYLCSICDGLHELHKNSIIHRDINPNNIIITFDGTLKICDYHISRVFKEGKSSDTQLLGTEGFVAPEHFGYRQTDERSDIYSVGILLNIMLTGATPQQKKYCKPDKFRRIIRKSTATDREERYRDVRRIKEEITGKVEINTSGFLSILRKIPGFRTFRIWKMFLAVILYPTLILINYATFIWGYYQLSGSIAKVLLGQVFLVLIPFVLYWDCGTVIGKLSVLRNFTRQGATAVRLITAVVIQCTTLILIMSEFAQ